ncbi:MAG: hypothetical protein GX303_02790 [Clostridiales bacterium]|nr:hypothetical protein [Clostridiales bacterium]
MNNQYENLNFGNGIISLEMMIIAIFIGAVLAAFAAVYNKRILGNFVWTLLKSGINSKENAKTIYELKFQKNPFLRAALREGSVFRRIVHFAEEDDEGAEGKRGKKPAINFKTARFYIPEELRIRAEIRYHRKGTDWLTFTLSVIIFAILAIGVYYILPELLTMLDNLITEIKPEPNYI